MTSPAGTSRKICYVSGTRADFGLMQRALQISKCTLGIDVCVCVTGMHLSATYGNTAAEIVQSGLRICGRIPVDVDSCTGASMAIALGYELVGITNVVAGERPDFVVLLGDRGEMLAGALAAIHLNVPIVHIHGGERSGTVDEPIRHAISKLAHYHFVATESARIRLIRMGEIAEHVFVTGAPGLDDLRQTTLRSRDDLCSELGFDRNRPIALVVFHPVLQEASEAGNQVKQLLDAVLGEGLQALCLTPNADAGSGEIREVLGAYAGHPDVRMRTHLGRQEFSSWMASADLMVGNSSSGIIEAASFSLPVINIGSRQNLREQSANTTNVTEVCAQSIRAAIHQSLENPRKVVTNIYGDGGASERIASLLARLPVTPALLAKSNAY